MLFLGSVVSMIEIKDCDAVSTLFATTVYKPPLTFHLQELVPLTFIVCFLALIITLFLFIVLLQSSLTLLTYVRCRLLAFIIRLIVLMGSLTEQSCFISSHRVPRIFIFVLSAYFRCHVLSLLFTRRKQLQL